jgi:nucleotide-binding universal stress UspA family protein
MTDNIELILVPTDFSPNSCEAFAWAALFARTYNAKILILHVLSEHDADWLTSLPGNPWERVLEKEDVKMIENFKSCMMADFVESLQKETMVAVGSAHTKIVEVASEKGASMIIMATHGRSGLSHVLVGSVAEKVIREAPCPVLSVKPAAFSS